MSENNGKLSGNKEKTPVTTQLILPWRQNMPKLFDIKLSITVKAEIRKDTPDAMYTAVCNMARKQGKLVYCGPLDDKWIIYKFADEDEMRSWMNQCIRIRKGDTMNEPIFFCEQVECKHLVDGKCNAKHICKIRQQYLKDNMNWQKSLKIVQDELREARQRLDILDNEEI